MLSDFLPDGTYDLTFSVESDGLAPIHTTATVGTRLSPPAGHEAAGYISSGTGYYPQGYLDPFVVGIDAANQGAIIPVNALPDNRVLTVHWFKKFNLNKPNSGFQDMYVPGKIGRYTVSYPTDADQIVIAEGIGTGDLPPAQAAGFVYTQNVSTLPGYNPNEEHAPSILGGRAYALRDDLNITSGAGYTSEPFLLLAYTDPSDNRPAMHAYEVVRSDADYDFDYEATAGTLLEIPQLASYAASFQTTMDNANARLNPLGLSADAIAFDISPSEIEAGKTHYEQVYECSLRALNNAAGAFNQAAVMTRSLRGQQNQIDDYDTTIAQQERAYVNALIDIYGRPYSGDIGAGKTYGQGYAGPDLFNWFIVDRPNGLLNTSETFQVTIADPAEYLQFSGNSINDLLKTLEPVATVNKTVTVAPSSFVQYNDTWQAGGLGTRAETGALQEALLDAQMTYLVLSNAGAAYRDTATSFKRSVTVFNALVKSHADRQEWLGAAQTRVALLEGVVSSLDNAADTLEFLASFNQDLGSGLSELFPSVLGLSSDATSAARGAAKIKGTIAAQIANGLALASRLGARTTSISILKTEQSLERTIQELEFGFEEVQMAYEIDNLYREHIGHGQELMQLTLAHQRALQQMQNVAAKGNRILADREIFRQRAAAIIQGYRTKDLTFRLFRNEALEQYRTLFDLASRYSYLAAKSYDYETGLLGTDAGQAVFNKIVASRSLGDLTGGVPQSTTSTLGDSGLAGTMAQLNADFSVAKGRLGLNNPDQYGTIFSLRHELFRILDDPAITSDDEAWQQALENSMVKVDDLMADADIAAMCLNLKRSDGAPVPGFVISFSTTIQQGKNFFGLDLAAGDHAFSASNFATKIYSAGIALPGYVGMDTYASGTQDGTATSTAPNALSATPYVYLIPAGRDYMRAPPLGDTDLVRSWSVADQALPLPYNLGATDFNSNQFFSANGTLSEQPWILRKHQAFRAVEDATLFYSLVPQEFTNSRLIGRSVWNGQWKILIPAYTLLNNEQQGMDHFIETVKDIQLFLRTYSNSGN